MPHAVGLWRNRLLDWAEGCRTGFYSGLQSDVLDEDGLQIPVVRIIGQLWNCTDTVPASVCDDFDCPLGSSYAQVVRAVKRVG